MDASRIAVETKGPWEPWFAWRPVRLIDRRWAWWREVYRGRWAMTCEGRYLGGGHDYMSMK